MKSMDYALQLILKQINQKFICIVDGKERSFTNGDTAVIELEKEQKHYSPVCISAMNNEVVLEVRDISEEIRKHNEDFIAEHKKRFGYEPNMFDGV